MDRCQQKGIKENAGGIIGLAKATLLHSEAIEHDLLRETGHELNDIGGTLSWSALDAFLRHAAPDSALMREINPEVSAWASSTKTNAILADIFDILATINANITAIGSGKPAKKPKPYPRPNKQDGGRHFGSKGLPPAELRKWIENKRKHHAGSSTSNHTGDPGS